MTAYNDMILACGAVAIGLIVWLMLFLALEFWLMGFKGGFVAMEANIQRAIESLTQLDRQFTEMQTECQKILSKPANRRKNRDRMTK